jgi:hypothetical protein
VADNHPIDQQPKDDRRHSGLFAVSITLLLGLCSPLVCLAEEPLAPFADDLAAVSVLAYTGPLIFPGPITGNQSHAILTATDTSSIASSKRRFEIEFPDFFR